MPTLPCGNNRPSPTKPSFAPQIEVRQKQLGGALPILELPGDKPRPALQSFKGFVGVAVVPQAKSAILALRQFRRAWILPRVKARKRIQLPQRKPQ